MALFGKDRQTAENREDYGMFDMQKIGINITKLRKGAGMTQMELADRLGISYQAVSNWERGVSMPDIAKLSDLSALFGVSIDEILDNRRAAEEAFEKTEEQEFPHTETPPIVEKEPLKPLININEIAAAAPFLTEAFLDETVEQFVQNGGKTEALSALFPFISNRTLNALAEPYIEKRDVDTLAPFWPFLETELIDRLAKELLEADNDVSSIAGFAPFISEKILNDIAKETLKENKLSALAPIMPFIDHRIIENYLREQMQK